jgi:hypothetical protein
VRITCVSQICIYLRAKFIKMVSNGLLLYHGDFLSAKLNFLSVFLNKRKREFLVLYSCHITKIPLTLIAVENFFVFEETFVGVVS